MPILLPTISTFSNEIFDSHYIGEFYFPFQLSFSSIDLWFCHQKTLDQYNMIGQLIKVFHGPFQLINDHLGICWA